LPERKAEGAERALLLGTALLVLPILLVLNLKHDLAKTKVQVAVGLDEQDRCDEAMPRFEEAIQQYPQDWYAWAGRGECFFKLNDLVKAEQSLHRAADLSHETRVIEQWQGLRARMGLAPAPAN
jgi:tetratricopeptide (TPR) repeat protein